MSNIQQQLSEMLTVSPSGPFLFLGSGFSRRYLGLEDWAGLLARYCHKHPIEYYFASANGSLARAASLVAADFHEIWWSEDEYAERREKFRLYLKDQTSALRIEISQYLRGLDQSTAKGSQHAEEVTALSSMNVDGVITTNWDLFVEDIFPEYKTYIGQRELLTSNPQGIGEIYKIHGCATNPASLVLTEEDYQEFNERNPYLAAKLITIFVEHPVIFIGYSLSDPNISAIVTSVAKCIGPERIDRLRRNLIFVQRPKEGDAEGVSETFLTVDGTQVPLVLVTTNDFLSVYEAINEKRRLIPARVLRFCKEQLYQIVKSEHPETKLAVVDYDELPNAKDVEFVVGIGVSQQVRAPVPQVGYAGITVQNLIQDVLFDDCDYEPRQVLETGIPNAARATKYCPVYKYLRSAGINSKNDYEHTGLDLEKWRIDNIRRLRVAYYARTALKKFKDNDIRDVIRECTPQNAASYIPCLEPRQIQLDVLEKFLKEHIDKMDARASSYASNFRKLAVLYDYLRWGWHEDG